MSLSSVRSGQNFGEGEDYFLKYSLSFFLKIFFSESYILSLISLPLSKEDNFFRLPVIGGPELFIFVPQ